MEDIAPKLLEEIQRDFEEKVKKNNTLKRITAKIEKGTATYADADEYAVEVGKILAEVYKRHLSSDILPDGKLYFNIAECVLTKPMERAYEMIDEAARKTQEGLNKAAGIGIAAISTPINRSRIIGIVEIVSAAENFDDVAHMLQEPVINFAQSIISDNVKNNVEFQGKAGLSPTIERIVRGDCCDWCSQLAGKYKYPKVPRDVYRRHRFCRCLVIYDPGDGSKENVHTKRQLTEEEKTAVERRKQFDKRLSGGIINKKREEEPSAKTEKAYSMQAEKALRKGIRKDRKQIEKHLEKIQHPEMYISNWNDRSDEYKKGIKKHWEKEISNFKKQITLRQKELERREQNGKRDL